MIAERFVDLHLNGRQWLIAAIGAAVLVAVLPKHPTGSEAYWAQLDKVMWGFALLLSGVVAWGFLTGDIRLHG